MASAFDSTLSGLGINRSTTAASVLAADSKQAKGTLDQTDFLKLMTAQLKNQDPFDPVDNTQMVAQMAQFSSLAGINEMSTTLKAISDKLGSTSHVGRGQLHRQDCADAGQHRVRQQRRRPFRRGRVGCRCVERRRSPSPTPTASCSRRSISANKKPVARLRWDGKLADGTDAGPGPFTVQVQARDGAKSVAARNLVWAPVAAVAVPSTGPAQLTIPGLGQVPVTAVRRSAEQPITQGATPCPSIPRFRASSRPRPNCR